MIRVQNECVDCGLPCIYEACRYYRVTRMFCDDCKDETDELYHFDGVQLCPDCILKQLERVEIYE